MAHVPVKSSNLASVHYDEPTQTLEIQFATGGIYQFQNVPAPVHDGLMNAASAGRYFANNIRGKYQHRKVA